VTPSSRSASSSPSCPRVAPFKPSKTVVRILAYAWGKETDDWPENARMTLYRDEKVKWAGQEVGGIRVSHLSHIDKQAQGRARRVQGQEVAARPSTRCPTAARGVS
jgi:hypothetical protein